MSVNCLQQHVSWTCLIVSFLLLLRHIKVATGPSADQTFVFTVKNAKEVAPGFVGFGMLQHKWAVLSLNQDVEVRPHQFDPVKDTLVTIVLEADFLMKKKYAFYNLELYGKIISD